MDLGFVGGINDQQDANASVFATAERSGEEYEAVAGERVHERRVVVDGWLFEGAFPVSPRRPRGADNGEVTHWSILLGYTAFTRERHGRSRWPTRRRRRQR